VNHGYAVINTDPRGVYNSEGNIYALGTQEGRDGADVIDWIGCQSWSNGKVGMSGNSCLAIAQWFIAAEQPKHLAAIAPWEGSSDLFREASPGGVLSKPALDFSLKLFSVNVGKGTWENPIAQILSSHNGIDYIEDKAAKMERIQVPAYVVASWSNPIHSYGTFRAFARLQTPKWLRVHDSWEWPDYYTEANQADLHRFYDYYLKEIDNGWSSTPQFRGKIIDTACPLPLTGTNLAAASFPPPETRPFKLFFHPFSRALEPTYPTRSSARFTAKSNDLVFEYTFPGPAIVCGPLDTRLAVSLYGGTDANIFVTSEKVLLGGAAGKQLKIPYPSAVQSGLIRLISSSGLIPQTSLLKYSGPWGKINVARRLMIDEGGALGMPICRMDVETPLQEGQIDIVKVPMVPMGMRFTAGEKLRIIVSGKNKDVFPPVDQATLQVVDIPDHNSGGVEVEIHAGLESKLASEITLQIIKDW
jgi:predicted acyl esterase